MRNSRGYRRSSVSGMMLLLALLTTLLTLSQGAFPGVHGGSAAISAASSPSHLTPPTSQHPVPLIPKEAGAGAVRPALSHPGGPNGVTARDSVPREDIFVPNPERRFITPAAGPLVTGYPTVPAPMGLSDLGTGSSGTYTYNSSSFEGTISLASFSAFSPGYPSDVAFPAPNWVLIQLNTVAVNVSYPRATNGTFWVQNAVHFNGSEMQFEDNIWNFSALTSSLGPSTLHSPTGTFSRGEVYYAFGPTLGVTYPFTLHFFNNITIVNNHPVVYLNYSIRNITGFHAGNYDVVTFNGAASALTPPRFEVSGAAYNKAGLIDDAELIIVGDGTGANANVLSLNGTATLDFWNATSGSYHAIRSAYDFGADSSETSLGIAPYYLGTTEYLNQGPSLLYGLWNTTTNVIARSALPGWVRVTVTTVPNYAFVFATDNNSANGPLANANYSYAPSDSTGVATASLPPPPPSDPYVFRSWANGFTNHSVVVSSNATSRQTLSLTSSPSVLDAPVYLMGDGEAAAFGGAGVAGTGYAPGLRTLWLNASSVVLEPPFLRVNDVGYPTFQLVATLGLSSSVIANAFVQGSTNFVYAFYNHRPVTIPGWTQGYFFFGGAGVFSVSNTTIRGNTPRFYTFTFPPASVEFYRTNGSRASYVAASYDANGVTAISSSSLVLSHLNGTLGAFMILAVNSTSVSVTALSAVGNDSNGGPTYALRILDSRAIHLTGVTVTNGAFGLDSNSVTHFVVNWMNVSRNATGFALNATSSSLVQNLAVSGGYSTSTGNWTYSTTVQVRNIAVNGSGLEFMNDSQVTVSGGRASGIGNAVVNQFENSSGGTFSNLNATLGAADVVAENSSNVVLTSLTATGGGVDAALTGVRTVAGTGLTASGNSSAVDWVGGSVGTFSSIVVSSESVGVFAENVSKVDVTGVRASNVSLDPSPFFSNLSSFVAFPAAGVGLVNVTYANVSSVSAVDYPFAVSVNGSSNVHLSQVESWFGGIAASINFSANATVTDLFAFGDQLGVLLANNTNVNVSSSTIEGSLGLGLWVENGTGAVVYGNNFVANNASSVDGVFNASRDQAGSNGTTSVSFSSNYWADRRAGTAYIINATAARDSRPSAALISSTLRFVEIGLAPGTVWGVLFTAIPYRTNVSLVVIPGWSLSVTSYGFAVLGPTGSTPRPSSGNVTWQATTQTVTIDFGPVSSPLVIPLWVYALAAVAVVVAIVVVLLRKGRRRERVI